MEEDFALMKIALALTAVLAAGPASAAFKCSARGGAVWHELRTEHFLLDTDLGSQRAAILLKQLETLHAMELQALVGEAVEIPGHLRVVAFADPGDFRELAGSRYIGGYYLVTGFGPMIVIPVEGFEANREVVAHELAHYLSHFIFPLQPLGSPKGWRRSWRRSRCRRKKTGLRSARTSSTANGLSTAVWASCRRTT